MFKSKAYLENPNNPDIAEEEKQRKFFYKFLMSQKELLRVPMGMHKEFGLKKNQINKKEDWSNVSRHCVTEMVAADIIAEKINLPEQDRKTLVQAVFLHDFYKKKSIDLIRANPENQTEADILSARESRQELEKHNIDPAVIALLEKSLGYDSLDYVINGQATLLEQIMHYVDDVTAGEDLVALPQRVEGLKKRYPIIDQEGIKRWGKPTYDVQLEAGQVAERNISAKLGLEHPTDLPNYIKSTLAEKINREVL
jgi:hypothetical protein